MRRPPTPSFPTDDATDSALPPIPDLPAAVRQLVRQIPSGRVATYGALALALGDRLASRWIGHELLHHDHDETCPCHRVVRVDGSLGKYIADRETAKIDRLKAEGIEIRAGLVDRLRYGFDDFRSSQPLLALRQVQRHAARQVRLEAPARQPITVAGLDVSYTAVGDGVAAYALVDFPNGELIWYATVKRRAPFPYIQSFLTFRELPLLLDLFHHAQSAGRLADVLMVDGSGLVHQHHIGLACHLGVTVAMPTIGVTKTLLCGQVDLAGLSFGESRSIVDRGRLIGIATKAKHPSEQLLYISPGNLVDVDYASRIVQRLLTGHRLPEPLYWADRLSRQVARGRQAELPANTDLTAPKATASRTSGRPR